MPDALTRARERLAARKKALTVAKKGLVAAQAAVKGAQDAVSESARTVKRLAAEAEKPGPWMPNIVHDPVPSIGKSTVGKKAGLLHTTEGFDFAVMDRVLKQKRACPHFLVGQQGQIKQYRPMWDAATALENPPGGVETNRKLLIQIEVCAFATSPGWPDEQRNAVAKVMAFCKRHGVPLSCSVTFTDQKHVKRMTGPEWVAYSGWCGHQHAPEQPSGHWDPGKVDIADLLARAKKL